LAGGLAAVAPLVVDPAAKPDPTVVVEPIQGVVVVVVGAGTVNIGAMPPLSISVAPRGIVPPVIFDPELDSDEAAPLETFDDAVVQLELAGPALARPPPSNIVPEFVVGPAPPLPDAPDSDDDPVNAQFVPAGLNPPGSSSVAPSGMLLLFDPPEPNTPSGEVVPIADAVVEVCAGAAQQLKRRMAVLAILKCSRRIESSCVPPPIRA
jgi:hypothetical protein